MTTEELHRKIRAELDDAEARFVLCTDASEMDDERFGNFFVSCGLQTYETSIKLVAAFLGSLFEPLEPWQRIDLLGLLQQEVADQVRALDDGDLDADVAELGQRFDA